jgi:carboxyl-terminal processing protease
MARPRLLKTATAIALVLSFVSVTVVFAQNNAGTEERTVKRSTVSDTYRALNLFGDVFEQVRANYVEPVEDKKLVEYALTGMLTNLDPHSSYMNDEETQSMSIQNKGEFGGLGIEVTMENGLVKVVSPIDDTPAARAGVQAGDMIVEINGEQVMGMQLSDAVNKMRGKVGTEIILTIVRESAKEPLKVKLTRDIIQIRSVRFNMEGDNIGYIRITTFNAQTFPGLEKAFTDLQKQAGNKLIGYVLDLRNNPGGLLDQAISVSDAFLERGEIVSTRGRNPEDLRRDNATPGDLAKGLPVVVLINGGSASASEIVAGALQDHKRGIVMGTQSFGKGSVQTLFNVPGGGSIRLTTARYYTPSGTSIQAKGITPDIIVERAKVVAEQESPFGEIHEADLRGALKNPDAAKNEQIPTKLPEPGQENVPVAPATEGVEKPAADAKKNPKDAAAEERKNDYQLIRAIDLLQGISLYGRPAGAAPAADAPARAAE